MGEEWQLRRRWDTLKEGQKDLLTGYKEKVSFRHRDRDILYEIKEREKESVRKERMHLFEGILSQIQLGMWTLALRLQVGCAKGIKMRNHVNFKLKKWDGGGALEESRELVANRLPSKFVSLWDMLSISGFLTGFCCTSRWLGQVMRWLKTETPEKYHDLILCWKRVIIDEFPPERQTLEAILLFTVDKSDTGTCFKACAGLMTSDSRRGP